MDRRRGRIASQGLAALLAAACGREAAPPLPPGPYTPRPEDVLRLPPARRRLRDDALARARVWRPPPPIEEAHLDRDPGPQFPTDELVCQFHALQSFGVTPKVHCVLPDGAIVKIKMGADNGEVFAEVAASRLLAALGFGADRMYVVDQVRCWGCPAVVSEGHRLGWPRPSPPVVTFEHAAVERRREGTAIEVGRERGWGWWELDGLDPGRGGASRAERDAFRLIAVFLAHWDNKPENQRLLCLPGALGPDGSCAEPLAYMHDVGATFGPGKVSIDAWRAASIWADRAACGVSMRGLPFGGGTFPDAVVSEGGRWLLAGVLRRLSGEQIRALFTGAHFPHFAGHSEAGRDVQTWVRTFQAKVAEIAEGPPCPVP